ncbi:MAG: DUF1223 domain-containing protein, partial [Gammaproteobacteria bacterium]
MKIRATAFCLHKPACVNPASSWTRHQASMGMTAILLLFSLLSFSAASNAAPLTLNSGTRQVTLLELYTSQGCSSCPPAERWLNEYVDNKELWTKIVPLAFHVDYWDYIGWKDIFATKANGERQRDYARAGKVRTVYTPGLFNNGREWRGWTLRLPARASDKQPGNLSATITDDHLVATFAAANTPLELHVALLGFGIDTKIERGENSNSTLRQEFVVLAHTVYPSDDGTW